MRNNPYQHFQDRTALKINFHTHAGVCVPGDCGELPMDDVVEAYRRAGYQALAISNHNRYVAHRDYEGIAVLDAVEYSAHPHMLLVGTREYHDLPHQEAIQQALAEGAFVVLNHPNWIRHEYLPWEMADTLQGYCGIEILNPVIYRLKGSGLALDTWDHLLTSGRQIWGFGNDDFHLWHDLQRAYNIVFARSAAFEDIKEAVLEGCFYVSDGVALKHLALEEDALEVEAGFFTESYVETLDYCLVGTEGRVLDRAHGKRVVLHFDPSEPYIRLQARAENGANLFLQPMMR